MGWDDWDVEGMGAVQSLCRWKMASEDWTLVALEDRVTRYLCFSANGRALRGVTQNLSPF